MTELPAESRRFSCSPSPARRAGRRRLASILAALALAAVAAGVVAWAGERRAPAVLAFLVAVLPLFAWRMSGDLDPVELGQLPACLRLPKIGHLRHVQTATTPLVKCRSVC